MQFNFRKLSRLTMAFWVSLSMLTAPYGYTTEIVKEGQRRLLFDHEAHKIYSAGVGIKELETKMMGETVDLGSGELTLKHNDISIPGNSKLPVEFTRVAIRDPNRPSFLGNPTSTLSRGLGNFHLDAAYLLLPSIASTGVAGCISEITVVDGSDDMYVTPVAYLPHDPQLLLKTKGTPNTAIFGAEQPKFTTTSKAKIKQKKVRRNCTWSLTETNGNVYEFDQVRVIETKNGKKKHAVLVTKITDVNGNWVKFSYGGNERRLEKISSSDDRVIVITYNSNGTVESAIASHGSKTTSPIVWVYTYGSVFGNSGLKYLKTARIQETKHYWEYNELKGITTHRGNDYARRCTFGSTARVRNPSGLVVEYTFHKIVNFEQAQSPDGHIRSSHRAACLPPTDVYNNVGSHANALRSASVSDGTSSYGKFSTFFSSAMVKKELKFLDGTSAVWTVQYDEGDLYNHSFWKYSQNKTVHKNQNNPVAVDITKPKTRTVNDPLGNRYVVKIGRSLNDSGLLVSKAVYAKGEAKPTQSVKNEYVHSKKRLGYTWNRTKSNLKSAEHWVRLSKHKLTQDGVTYTTAYQYDAYGLPIKVSKSSTLQSGSIIETITYTHITSKWIIGLVKSLTVNGREVSGASYDSFGQKTLETKFGQHYMRYEWNYDGTLATKRNGNNKDTEFYKYKRGLPQTTVYSNGGVEMQTVDDNGRITQTTSLRNYVETMTYNQAGLKTKIDRPKGKSGSTRNRFADTIITYKWPTSNVGLIKTEITESGKLCKEVITTYNSLGLPILIETKDTGNNISIYERIGYDKLGREVFKSFPSDYASVTFGTETKYDVLGRKIMERKNVSPYKTETVQYMKNNKIKYIDPRGNVKLVHNSGYGSPYDGQETQIVEANGRKTFKTYDEWRNLTQIREVGAGKTNSILLKYNSYNQLCMYTSPESGSVTLKYNSTGRVSRIEQGVPADATCSEPTKTTITKIPYFDLCSTQVQKISIGESWQSMFEYRGVKKCITLSFRFPFWDDQNNQATTPEPSPNSDSSSKCELNEVLNGKQCVSVPNGSQIHSDTIQKRTGTLYQYNDFGQVTKIDYPNLDSPDISYTYYIDGSLTKIVRDNVTLEYKFNLNRQITNEVLSIVETGSDNKTVTKRYNAGYSYNALGGKTLYASPSLRIISFELNALNQIMSVSSGKIKLISNITYHPNSLVKSAKIHSTNVSQNTKTLSLNVKLNFRMLIEKISLSDSTNDIFSFTTAYYKDGRVKTVTNNLLSGKIIGDRNFSYDEMNYLKSASGDNELFEYSYDSFANLVSQTSKLRSIENKFDANAMKLIENLDREKNMNGLVVRNNDQTVTIDSLGRITKIGKLNLTYDDSNDLTKAVRNSTPGNGNSQSSSTVQQDILQFKNDGNHNRANVDYYFISDTRKPNDKIHLKTHEFHSIFGDLLFQFTSIDPPTISNPVIKRTIGRHDFVEINSFVTLKGSNCLNWVIFNHSNNNSIVLNSDLSVQSRESIGPFGRSWNEGTSNFKRCERDTTVLKIPNLVGPFFPVGFGLSSSPTSSDTTYSLELDNQSSSVFQDALRDNVTELYFLRNKRYYHSSLGRHITPNVSDVLSRVQGNLENSYAIANNDPVNLRLDNDANESFVTRIERFNGHSLRLQSNPLVPSVYGRNVVRD